METLMERIVDDMIAATAKVYQERYEKELRESFGKLGMYQQMSLKLIEMGVPVEQISAGTGLEPQRIRALKPF